VATCGYYDLPFLVALAGGLWAHRWEGPSDPRVVLVYGTRHRRTRLTRLAGPYGYPPRCSAACEPLSSWAFNPSSASSSSSSTAGVLRLPPAGRLRETAAQWDARSLAKVLWAFGRFHFVGREPSVGAEVLEAMVEKLQVP
jgi:hypothetical protein